MKDNCNRYKAIILIAISFLTIIYTILQSILSWHLITTFGTYLLCNNYMQYETVFELNNVYCSDAYLNMLDKSYVI